jgi:ankyrin repeat protein
MPAVTHRPKVKAKSKPLNFFFWQLAHSLCLDHFHAMSQPTADTVDDILYCARYGELEELTNANFPTSYLLAADESGNTALHMACANGHLGIDPPHCKLN